MEKRIDITKRAPITTIIADVFKNNLFSLMDDGWVYVDDLGQVVITATYKIEGDEVVFDIWTFNKDLQIITDKIIDEIKTNI